MRQKLLLLLCLVIWGSTRAQDCANNFLVNLSANPESSYSISAKRQGDCCGDQNCISFTITVHPDADLISLTASKYPLSSFYTVNCGTPVAMGSPACIAGLNTVSISFCKPGNDLIEYTITTSVTVKPSPDITLRQGCTGSMSITGLNPATTTWTSIFPGNPGDYNSYLSQTSGSTTVNVTPQPGAPAYIDYRVSGNRASGCTDIKSAVIRVYTTPPLTVSIDPPSPVICAGNSITLTAIPAGGNAPYTYLWSTGQTTASISVNTPGTYSVAVNDNTAGCGPITQSIVVGAAATPSPPTAANTTVCYGTSATLGATAPGGLYEWFSAASGGTALGSGPTFVTPVLTANTTYYVQTTLGGCTSARTPVNVSVTPLPAAPTVSGSLSVCSGSTTTLTATAPGGTYSWYDAASGGTLLHTGSSYTTPALTAARTFYVQTFLNGCTGPRTAVTVTVKPIPTAPAATGDTVCPGNQASLQASAPGGTYRWYTAALGGTLLHTGATYTTPVLNTSTTYYVESEIDGCTGPRTAVTATVITRTVPEFTYSSGTYCATGDDPTPTVNSPGGGTFSASPAGLVIDPATGTIDVSLSSRLTYTVSFTSSGPCPLTTTAFITITDSPDASFSYNGPFCQGGTNPLPVFTTGSAGVFTSVPNDLVFANSSTGEIDLQQSPPGTYTITNTISASEGCALVTATFSVTIHPLPLADAGADRVVCAGSSASLSATASNNSSVTWSIVSGSGTFDDPNILNPVFTPAAGVSPVILRLTAHPLAGSSCGVTTDEVSIVFSAPPPAPTAQNAVICSGSAATLEASGPGDTYEWYDSPNFGTLLGTGSSYLTPALTAPTTFYVQATLAGCTSARTAVTVTVNTIPPAPAVSNKVICQGSSVTLSAPAAAGTYEWYDAATGGNLLYRGTDYVTPALSQNTTYYLQLTVNGCTSSRTAISVAVTPTPAAPAAAPVTICAGNTATLLVSSPGTGTYQWFADPAGTTPLFTGTSFTTPALNATATYYLMYTESGCPSARTPVTVTVNAIPAAPQVQDQSICEGSTATLRASGPGDVYRWYDALSGGNWLYTGNDYVTPALSANTTYYVESTIAGCTGPRAALTVIVNPIPAAPVIAGKVICEGQSTTLSAPAAAGFYDWYDAPSAGTLLYRGDDFETPILASNTSYYVQLTQNGCTGPRTMVTVTVNPTPPAPTALPATICAGNSATLQVSAPGAGTYQWFDSPNSAVALATGTSFTTPVLTASTAYYLQYTFNNCHSIRTPVNVTVNPIPVAPVVQNATICSGNTATLTATLPGPIYRWYDAANASTPLFTGNTYITPQLTSSVTYSVTYYVDATISGCTGPRAAVTVTVNPIPPAPLLADGSVCQGSSATITAPPSSGMYEWFDTGTGGTPLHQGQAFTTPGLSQSTTYYVQLTVNGCTSPRTAVNVQVNPIPAAPAISAPLSVCSGQAIQLSTPLINGASYQWSGPGGFSSTARAPLIAGSTVMNSGIYRLRITVNGCVSPESAVTVMVSPLNTANAGNNLTVCRTAVEVQLGGTISGSSTAQWSSSGTGIFSPGGQALDARYLPSDQDKANGSVMLTLTTTGNTVCPPAQSSLTLSFAEPPTVSAGADQVLCADVPSVTLFGQSANANTVTWSSSGTGTFSAAGSLQPIYSPSQADRQAGQVRLQVTASGAASCASVSDEMILTLAPAPFVDAGPDRTVYLNRTFRVNPVVRDPNLTFNWTPNLYMDDPALRNPLFTAVEDQAYTLTVTDALGCRSQDDVLVRVLKPILIPNTFTPNGDGTNDYWEIRELAAYTQAAVRIYNRYGEILYYSLGYENPWDGTYKGSPLPVGTYYYVIRTNFEDMVFSGSITILR